MDVDGTLTDGKIYMGENGEVMKSFDVKDGLGIKLLIAQNIIPAIITGRRSLIVENRCREIGITEIHQGVKKKDTVLRALMDKYHLSPPISVTISTISAPSGRQVPRLHRQTAPARSCPSSTSLLQKKPVTARSGKPST